jgi:hypothetical protein
MDDFGNFLYDIEYLFSGYDYGPFGIVPWSQDGTDTDEEFHNI